METLDKNQRIHALVHQENLDRIFKFGIIFMAISLIALYISASYEPFFGIRDTVTVVLTFHLIILAVIWDQKRKYYSNHMINSILEKVYFIFMLLWSTGFTVTETLEAGELTVFEAMTILMCLMILMRWEYILVAVGMNGALLLFIGFQLYGEEMMTLPMIARILLFTGLGAWLGHVLGRRHFELKHLNMDLLHLKEELERTSALDAITKLYTYDYVHSVVEQNLNWKNDMMCLMIMDIDNFRLINQEHGHLFADDILREIATELKTHTRGEDIVGRYAGDEFIIVMPHITAEAIDAVAHRFKSAIESMTFGSDVRITVSIGGICYMTGTALEVVGKADSNLATAKARGNSQIEISCAERIKREY